MSINRVTLMGRLTRDIESRTVGAANTPVASFTVALSEYYKNQAGERVETSHYFDVVTWGKQAEHCAKYLSKGRLVVLEGRLQHDRWENEEGVKRQRVKVRAERVHFLDAPKKSAVAPASKQVLPRDPSKGRAIRYRKPKPASRFCYWSLT